MRYERKCVMATANNVLSCSLCNIIILLTEHRKVFSSSSEFVLLLLKQVVVDVFRKRTRCFSLVRHYVVHAIDGLRQ